MAINSINLQLISFEKSVIFENVKRIIATTESGVIEITAGHISLLSQIEISILDIYFGTLYEKPVRFYINGGILKLDNLDKSKKNSQNEKSPEMIKNLYIYSSHFLEISAFKKNELYNYLKLKSVEVKNSLSKALSYSSSALEGENQGQKNNIENLESIEQYLLQEKILARVQFFESLTYK